MGWLPPPHRRLERGALGRSEKAREDGVIGGEDRGTRATAPKACGVASRGTRGEEGGRGARRAGQPGRAAPPRRRVSYLPPAWVPAVSSLASLYFGPVPLLAARPRAARGGPRSRSPLRASSASCPVAPRASLGLCPPDDPPCNSSTKGRRPPAREGRPGWLVPAGLKYRLGCALFVCLFVLDVFFFLSLFCFCFLEFFVCLFGFFFFFFGDC